MEMFAKIQLLTKHRNVFQKHQKFLNNFKKGNLKDKKTQFTFLLCVGVDPM